jgi:hypothetical protein
VIAARRGVLATEALIQTADAGSKAHQRFIRAVAIDVPHAHDEMRLVRPFFLAKHARLEACREVVDVVHGYTRKSVTAEQ